jgi:RNA binding exosome subunit
MYDDLDGFEEALSYFGNRVEIICAMELSGRITAENAYQQIKDELKDLKKIRKKVKNDSDYGFEWTPLHDRD